MITSHFVPYKHWALIAAAWGDVLCSLSAIEAYGIRKVIYFGNMNMREFLEAQTFIDKVIIINPDDYDINRDKFQKMWSHICMRTQFSDNVIASILKTGRVDVDLTHVYNASVDINGLYQPMRQTSNLVLPEKSTLWAENVVNSNNLNQFILIQPYSLNSSGKSEHWPQWNEYLDWLINEHPNVKFVFGGIDYNPVNYLDKKNVLNLYRQSPNVTHLWALANKAQAIITTVNGLSHWCNSQNLRTIALHNQNCSRPHDFFDRIYQSENLYDVNCSTSLDILKGITNSLIDLSGDGPIDKPLIKRVPWLEEGGKMENIYSKMPCIPHGDIMSDWGQAEDSFDLYRKISSALEPASYYEIGARLGHGILAFIAGSSSLTKIGWCDNESYIPRSNQMTTQNIDAFFKRYRNKVIYSTSYVTDISEVSSHANGYQIITVDGEHSYEGKIRDLNIALECHPEMILVDDYFYLPIVRKAIKDWAASHDLNLYLVHTFRGLAVFDLTMGEKNIKKLQNASINCDIIH